MQREEAYPPSCVNCVLMWVIARFRNKMRDVVDSDNSVEQNHYDK